MAVIYVDPLNGTDNGDAGRGEDEGPDAYASISYALANYGSFSTTTANTIKVADTAADVLTAPLDADTSVSSVDAPLGIVGYHYDGSNGGTAGALTVSLPWGATVSGAEIDGDDAVSYIFDSATNYVHLANLKVHSTTSYVLYLNAACTVMNCEVFNGSSGLIRLAANGVVRSCKVYNDVSTGAIGVYTASSVCFCEISGVDTGIYLNGTNKNLSHNLIYNVADEGIRLAIDYASIFGNTIDGGGGNSTACGIRNSNDSANFEMARISDNLITNFDGATSKGIYLVSGTTPSINGNNAFYNNTTDSDTPPGAIGYPDISEGSDPYTDSASEDFSLTSGASSLGAAMFHLADPANPDNIGAWQDYSSGGGGGGGQTSHTFAG